MPGLPTMPRSGDEIHDTYCLFCGWPVIIADDPDKTDFCEHVLFVATDEGGVTHIGIKAREYLAAEGIVVTAWGAEWEVAFPASPDNAADLGALDSEDVDDVTPTVAETVQKLADAFEIPEGLLIHDQAAFLGDPALYIALGRW